jgi:glyoxylase-like metal-dependent hydrolase (beta-lactamase superfamily II)
MKIFKNILKVIGVLLLVIIVTVGSLYLMYLRPFMNKMKETSTIQYDKDLTLIIGGGGNSGVLVSDSLVLVIDTKMDDAANELYKTVKELSGTKPILVVNTHIHPDHNKGNSFYKGQNILAGGNYTKEEWLKEASEETLPTIWLKDKMEIPMGDDTATIFNLNKMVHTSSDVMVYLHRRKMLFAGDVILNKQVPVVMGKADPEGYMAVMKELPVEFDIQKIVPGHGAVGGMEILNTFKQYFLEMKLAAQDPSKEKELIAKYKDWNQIPMLMSPGATIKRFKK